MRRADQPLEIAVLGTGTGVGKTQVVCMLVRALRARARARPVWVHKPVACGGWDGNSAEDGRRLAALAGDGQLPATICPAQFPEAASPHLAAAAAGVRLSLAKLRRALAAVRGDHDLVIEGVGGVLTPLSRERATICDLLAGTGIAVLLVTTPTLGTLNQTAMAVECLRRRRLGPVGLVLGHVVPDDGSLAVRSAARELQAITGLPLFGEMAHGDHLAVDGLVRRLLRGLMTLHAR